MARTYDRNSRDLFHKWLDKLEASTRTLISLQDELDQEIRREEELSGKESG